MTESLRVRRSMSNKLALTLPDSKIHGDNMVPTWVLSSPAGPCWPHEPCYQVIRANWVITLTVDVLAPSVAKF